MIHTFSAVFVRFVAPTSGEEALVSKPVAARGFMSGRGPEPARSAGEWEGRSERSERRVLTPMLPAARWGKPVAARGSGVCFPQRDGAMDLPQEALGCATRWLVVTGGS